MLAQLFAIRDREVEMAAQECEPALVTCSFVIHPADASARYGNLPQKVHSGIPRPVN